MQSTGVVDICFCPTESPAWAEAAERIVDEGLQVSPREGERAYWMLQLHLFHNPEAAFRNWTLDLWWYTCIKGYAHRRPEFVEVSCGSFDVQRKDHRIPSSSRFL